MDYRELLRASDRDRAGAFAEAAIAMETSPQNVEKDFWICLLLDAVFLESSRRWPRMAFRGGTSLSRAHKLINRFSEDIDIGISREDLGFKDTLASIEKLASGQHLARLDAFTNTCGDFIANIVKPHVEAQLTDLFAKAYKPEDQPKVRIDPDDALTLEIPYVPISGLGDGYVPSTVRLEFSIRSALTPKSDKSFAPYVASVLEDSELVIANVPTIAAKRTFWDKILIAHELKQRYEKGLPLVQQNERVSRHYYDLWMLINSETGSVNKTQIRLLDECRRYSSVFYPNPEIDLSDVLVGSLDITPPREMAQQLASDYRRMAVMIFGEPPHFDEVIGVLTQFQDAFNSFAG